MTVQTTTNKATFNGTGTTGPFTFNFRFFKNSEIQVTRTEISTGVETTLTDGGGADGYTLTGAGDYAGGAVTTVTAVGNATQKLTVRRVIDVKQETDLRNQGAYFAEIHEDVFDRQAMVDQQQDELIERAIKIPVSSDLKDTEIPGATSAALRADTVVGFGTDGKPKLFASPDNAALSASLASTASGKGSALVGYLPAGSGAVGTTVQAKLRELVSVFDFMTAAQVADVQAEAATLDVRAAIQLALDSGASGVYFPPGVYLIGAELFPRSNTTIVFDGWIKVTPTNDGFFDGALCLSNSRGGQAVTNVTIVTPKIDCNNTPGGIGILVRDEATNVQIIGPHIKNCVHDKFPGGYGGGRALQVEAGTGGVSIPRNVVITNFIVENCYNAVALQATSAMPSQNIVIDGGVAYNCERLLFVAGNGPTFPHPATDMMWVFANVSGFNCGNSATYPGASVNGGIIALLRASNGLVSNVRVVNDAGYGTVKSAVCGEASNVVIDNYVIDGNLTNIVSLNSYAEDDNQFNYKFGSRKLNYTITQYGACTDTIDYAYSYNAALTGGTNDANPFDNTFKIQTEEITGNRVVAANVATYPRFFIDLYEMKNNKRVQGVISDMPSNVLSSYGAAPDRFKSLKVRGVASDFSDGVQIESLAPAILLKDTSAGAHWFRSGMDANTASFYISTDSGASWGYGLELRFDVLRPLTDNNVALGAPTRRWSVVYAGTGAINTSDEREKQDIAGLDEAEKRVAVALKGLVKKFRFRDALQAKGGDARIHVGWIAQEVVAAFQAEGLDPMRYGIVCYDEWEDEYKDVTAFREVVQTDESGKVTVLQEECATGERELVCAAGNRYGVRYEELLAFVLAAL